MCHSILIRPRLYTLMFLAIVGLLTIPSMLLQQLIGFEKAKIFVVALTAPVFAASIANAQFVPPLSKSLIEDSGDTTSSFSLGYGAGVANYMCYEALKGNLAKVDGDEILAKYKLWFENQKTYQFNQFIKGYLLEMENFNQVFT